MVCRMGERWVEEWLPTGLAASLFLVHALVWGMVAAGVRVGYMPWWVIEFCAAVVRRSLVYAWLIWGV